MAAVNVKYSRNGRSPFRALTPIPYGIKDVGSSSVEMEEARLGSWNLIAVSGCQTNRLIRIIYKGTLICKLRTRCFALIIVGRIVAKVT